MVKIVIDDPAGNSYIQVTLAIRINIFKKIIFRIIMLPIRIRI